MNQGLPQRVGDYLKKKSNVLLTGLSGSARSFFLAEMSRSLPGKVLCLVPGEEKAYDLARELQGFVEPERVHLFLGRDLVFVKENYTQVEIGRLLTLQSCQERSRRSRFLIATPAGMMHSFMSPQEMEGRTLKLQVGEEVPVDELLRRLVDNGYLRVDTVARPGEFARRGGILDLFPPGGKNPARIEFFGDSIDSLRGFDVDSQRSGKHLPGLRVVPADEFQAPELEATLLDYLSPEVPIFFDEPRDFLRSLEREARRYQDFLREARREGKEIRELPLVLPKDLNQRVGNHPVAYHSYFPGNIPQVQVALMEHVSQQEMEPFYHNLSTFYSRLADWQKKGYRIQIAVRSKTAREQMKQELTDQHLIETEFTERPVEKGFISSTLGAVLVSEKDLWGKARPGSGGRQKRRRQERVLLEDLKMGSYVVHENHGIGIFRGVTQVETDGVTREYILLQYAGTDRLYLPVDKLDHLFKYTTSEEKAPRLSKLGGSEWDRTKRKVSQAIQEMAGELLHLYAARQAREGYQFSPDTPWQGQFEDTFPFEETPDQLKAVQDIKRDMENRRPMDRLICGDVGYGKTEVAMRAVFKAVMDGKQVAILVPTTVLAEQHFQTFRDRFADFPAQIEVLSRFRSGAEQRRIITDLERGVVDVVIGTHRLLSRDIRFKDLGLLVVDEEHRFGVAQKEKIKALRELVDVISLSATPIPRSLHMSLTGLRDLSVIETPPPERYPITTYVLEYNEEIITQAVWSELQREGQVFFVHNRIEDIDRVKEKLETMLPGVSIGVGHGRMKEEELSRTMMDFLHGKHQVFLCTTIIESGLDMPNVNTIIVDQADKMGLAQLYQLRGRVGRSNRIAYAYLTYRPDKIITETAQKRLNAIREFNELGSGMKIALRDLEIRGAGNILGPEQHGHIHAVGFDLYCRLLEQETARLRGHQPRPELNTQMDIDVDYYIPDTYIPDSGTKMRVYRRLLLAVEPGDVEEIRSELQDRFGPPPPPVENFLQIASLRIQARGKDIKALRRKGNQVEIKTVGKLPANLSERFPGHRVRRVNDRTLLLSLEGGASLQGLAQVLELI